MKLPERPNAYSAYPPIPPALRLKRPHLANAYASANEPSAVTIQEKIDIVPTCASLLGSMTMPDPSMLTAVSTVSCTTLIFLTAVPTVYPFLQPETTTCLINTPHRLVGVHGDESLLLEDVAISPQAAIVFLFQVHALQLRGEPRELIDSVLECEEVLQRRTVPDLTGHHAQQAWRIR